MVLHVRTALYIAYCVRLIYANIHYFNRLWQIFVFGNSMKRLLRSKLRKNGTSFNMKRMYQPKSLGSWQLEGIRAYEFPLIQFLHLSLSCIKSTA